MLIYSKKTLCSQVKQDFKRLYDKTVKHFLVTKRGSSLAPATDKVK